MADYHIKELWCRYSACSIFGKAYIPDGEGRHPLIIFSHELGNNHEAGIPYAEKLAASGYAVYTFDFCGGSVAENRQGEIVRTNRSTGRSTKEMSSMTEVSDLEAVLAQSESWEFADQSRVYLMGGSQGAVVSVLAACRNKARIKGLILLYPPLDLPERMHALFPGREQIPDTFDLFGKWVWLGRRYADDIWDLDVYRELSGFSGLLLILHGDADRIVDISVSERAAEMLPDCTFCRISGGRHVFSDAPLEEAKEKIWQFLDRSEQG